MIIKPTGSRKCNRREVHLLTNAFHEGKTAKIFDRSMHTQNRLYGGKSSTLTGNKASSNGGDGIFAYDGSIVIGNTAYDNGEHGISVTFSSTVKNNAAHWNQRYGINLTGQDLVDGNTASNNNRAGGYGNMSACATCTMGLNHAP